MLKIPENIIVKNTNEAIEHICNLIKFKSISYLNIKKDAPFGEGGNKALQYVLDLAKSWGFKTFLEKKHKYGYMEFGEGKKIFAILSHLDVVPEGDLSKWISSPWNPFVKNGYVFGRGSLDDKGPSVMNMYALKYLKDLGYKSKDFKIRIIFCLTEETTWESIRCYLKDEPIIHKGYVPDGLWPVIKGEKPIIHYDLKYNKPFILNIKEHNGAYNMINDLVTVEGPIDILKAIATNLTNNSFTFNLNEKQLKLTVEGLSGHGSEPTLGKNAIIGLVHSMPESILKQSLILKYIKTNFGLDWYDVYPVFKGVEDESGKYVSNIGKINLNNKNQSVSIEIRMPVTISIKKTITDIKKDLLNYPELKYCESDAIFGKYIQDSDPDLIKMMSIYHNVTRNYDAKPICIGGATFARAHKNLIAFGASHKIESMHSVNEKIKISDLKNMFPIYVNAIINLANLKK